MGFPAKAAAVLLLLFINSIPAGAVVIRTQRLGYVDLERVYENLIVVEEAREDIGELIRGQRIEVEEKRERIERIEERLSDWPDPEQDPEPGDDEPGAPAELEEEPLPEIPETEEPPREDDPPREEKSYEELQELLQEKERALDELRAQCLEDIEERQQAYRRDIMSRIYEAVGHIARRDGYTALLDGDIVFFTGDDIEDITGQVIEYLNEQAPRY